MSNGNENSSFAKSVEPLIRGFIENIESPFVWAPLGLFALCVLAFPVTQFQPFLYLAVVFLVLTFAADWVGRWRNRKPLPAPQQNDPEYRDQLFTFLAGMQAKAVAMLKEGKPAAARSLTRSNLKVIEKALKAFPDDPDFLALLGYTMKDMFQGSRESLPLEMRRLYLAKARSAFEAALAIDPDNASAHNGMGNVFFFEGRFDDALKEHAMALEIEPTYAAATHDADIVRKVKEGVYAFNP